MRIWIKTIAAGAVLLVLAVSVQAGANKEIKKKAKEMTRGTLYLRMDAPCATGRHAYGTYKRPLVEVTPEGIQTDPRQGSTYSWWHSDSTYWGVRINDPVRVDEIDVEKGEVELELDGIGPAGGNSTVIKLLGVHTPEDLEAAFDKAFSKVPLQDEHDDWSDEIKEAIKERRLVNGMTKRQAYYVTGAPDSHTEAEEGGSTVEIWRLRQSKGVKTGYWGGRGGESTGLPGSVKFVDGALVEVGAGGGSDGDFLDD
jgi:hypothetical protein